MQQVEVKALDRELAIKRAKKILELEDKEFVFDVIEKVKPKKKFFGLLGTEMGVYQVTATEKVEKIEKSKKDFSKNREADKKHAEKIEKKEMNKNRLKEEIPKSKNKEETIKIKEKDEVKKENIVEIKNEGDVEKIKTKTKTLLELMGLDLDVEIKNKNDKTYILNLIGKDNAIIIGKQGKTLNSFEYLLKFMLKEYKIEVDVENFKEKRNDTLRELARKMAEKAMKTNRVIRLNPMPPRERKIIHEILNDYFELDTYSEGKDPKRHIVIKRKRY